MQRDTKLFTADAAHHGKFALTAAGGEISREETDPRKKHQQNGRKQTQCFQIRLKFPHRAGKFLVVDEHAEFSFARGVCELRGDKCVVNYFLVFLQTGIVTDVEGTAVDAEALGYSVA